jgi:hypothetical protein
MAFPLRDLYKFSFQTNLYIVGIGPGRCRSLILFATANQIYYHYTRKRDQKRKIHSFWYSKVIRFRMAWNGKGLKIKLKSKIGK